MQHRYAQKRATITLTSCHVCLGGRVQGTFLIHSDHGIERGVEVGDAVYRLAGQFDTGDGSRGEFAAHTLNCFVAKCHQSITLGTRK